MHPSDVGTGVAKPDVAMPAASFLHRPAPAAVFDHAPDATFTVNAMADRPADFTTSALLAPEAAVATQRAVEAVLTAADRVAASGNQAVNLQFSVGGADLTVRVELKDDAVHATFRTDSPELRNALAHEWQTVNGGDTGDRATRLASPVFTSHSSPAANTSDSTNLSSFSGGESSSRQRESGARRTSDESFEVAAARARARGTRASSTSADSLPSVTVARHATSSTHRLHAHA